METAVDHLRSRMAAANRRFLDGRIESQRSMPISDFGKLYGMVRYWFRWDEESKAWNRQLPPDASQALQNQARLEAQVTSLDDVAALPHYHLDGTEEPFSEDQQKLYIRVLKNVVNATADKASLGLADGNDIELPVELSQFLSLTPGAYDPDFRHSGMCDLSFMKHPAKKEEDLYETFKDSTKPEAWPAFINQHLEVAVGVLVDMKGQWPELWPDYYSDMWYSLYAYCRLVAGQDGKSDGNDAREFGWKVIFCHYKTVYDEGAAGDERNWDDEFDSDDSMYDEDEDGDGDGDDEEDEGEDEEEAQGQYWEGNVVAAESENESRPVGESNDDFTFWANDDYEMWSFDSIPAFLDWFASWEDRLDHEAMDHAVSGRPPTGHQYAAI